MKKILSLTALTMLTPMAALAVEQADNWDGVQLSQYYSDNFTSEPYFNMDERKAPENVDSYSSRYDNKKTAAAADERKWELSLGVSVTNHSKFIGSRKDENTVLPFIYADYKLSDSKKVFISPQGGIGYQHAYSKGVGIEQRYNDMLATGIRTNTRQGRAQGDDPQVRGTGTVKRAIEVGPYVDVNLTKDVVVHTTALFDVNDAYNGFAFELDARYNLPTGSERLNAGLNVGTTYGSSNFMNYYYQVKANEVLAGRDEFSPESGFQEIRYGFDVTYFITRNVFLRGDARMRHLVGDAKDSPLTRKDQDLLSSLTVAYRF